MNRKFTKLAVSLTLILAISSCDSFVEIDPYYAQDADAYFNSADDYNKALTGAYDLLQTSYLDLFIGEIASDNSIAGGESVTDSEGLHQIDAMTHGGVNVELRNLFRWMYTGITRVNYIFEFKDKVAFDGKNKILAEAAFLRAYYYFQLVKFFGYVPLVIDKRLGASGVPQQARTTATQVYAQIEKDLLFAASNLNWTALEKGRVTKGAALALLGKVYLYQNKFDQASTTLDQVINQGQYSLFAEFDKLFLVANESSSETVFDVQYVGTEGGGFDCFVCLEGFIAPGFQGIRGYTGPIYAAGFSYNLPTRSLYNEFEAGDVRREASILNLSRTKDSPGKDEVGEYQFNTDADFIKANPTVSLTKGAGGHTGYYNNKYIKRLDQLGLQDQNLTSPVNHKIIRYADVLLMAAEAHNRKPSANDQLALQYVNQVRARAKLPAILKSGTELTTAIYHERRVEFAGEGHRFFDLVRTGQAAEKIKGFKKDKNELFPIPQAEIDLANAGWVQNKGYN